MHAFPALPSRFRWSPEQIAGAVPPRLGDLLDFDAFRAAAPDAANAPRQRLRIAHGYRVDAAPAPRFRIS
jgi:hypothetical protein